MVTAYSNCKGRNRYSLYRKRSAQGNGSQISVKDFNFATV